MKCKIFLAVLMCVIPASLACGEAKIFVGYPALGECTADSVMIRTSPDTNAKIIGRLNEHDKIIILRKTKDKSGTWYEVDNPTGEGEAYVPGKYLTPAYRQEFQRSAGAKILTDIRLTYGATPEKMSALSGGNVKLSRIDSNTGFPFVVADFGDYRALYRDNFEGRTGYLKSLAVKSGNKPFGNIHIGDSTDNLRRELGDPVNESGSLWEYEIYLYGYHEGYVEELVDACIFRFGIEDGKISRMYYYNHENGEDGETEW